MIRAYLIRTFIYTYILPGSVLAAKSDPGVPYTYIHTYILPGSVLAAKSDPGVPYAYTHVHMKITRSGSVLAVAGHACTKCTWTCLVFMYWLKKDVFSCMHACCYPSESIRNGFVPILQK